MDANTTLEAIKSHVAQFARARDWEQFHAPKNLSMAIAAEAGELMEHFLWCSPEESAKLACDPIKREKIVEELADVVILSIQFSNMTGIDLSDAIAAKVKKNAEKYPVERAKGRSQKYTEL